MPVKKVEETNKKIKIKFQPILSQFRFIINLDSTTDQIAMKEFVALHLLVKGSLPNFFTKLKCLQFLVFFPVLTFINLSSDMKLSVSSGFKFTYLPWKGKERRKHWAYFQNTFTQIFSWKQLRPREKPIMTFSTQTRPKRSRMVPS